MLWRKWDRTWHWFEIPNNENFYYYRLHATILACMGIDHTKLTYRFNGRDFRLTDVAGNVVQPILT